MGAIYNHSSMGRAGHRPRNRLLDGAATRSSRKSQAESCRKEKEALGVSPGKNLGKRKEDTARGERRSKDRPARQTSPKGGIIQKELVQGAAAKEEGALGSLEAVIAGNRESKQLYIPLPLHPPSPRSAAPAPPP